MEVGQKVGLAVCLIGIDLKGELKMIKMSLASSFLPSKKMREIDKGMGHWSLACLGVGDYTHPDWDG